MVPAQGPNAHHGPLAPGLRLTASDRPGVAQPVPERDVPAHPWARMVLIMLLLVAGLTALWEGYTRTLGFEVGDLGDDPSSWAEQWRRIGKDPGQVAIVGDSRILFGTDLDRFAALTGTRPIQLALEGTNARPFLEEVAKSPFNGLLIVGIADQSYFRKGAGMGINRIKVGHWEAPNKRVSFVIERALRRHLAMLDEDASVTNMIVRTDHGWRKGADTPYDGIWKVGVTHDDRQFWLWPEIARNPFLLAHTIKGWMFVFGFPPPKPEIIAMTQAKTRDAVARIRTRGGDVIFVRPPSAPKLRALEDSRLPRAVGWDPLLRAAHVQGIHADDMPALKGITLPELSHVSRSCGTVFTDAYVRAVASMTPRLVLRSDAPRPLTAADCH